MSKERDIEILEYKIAEIEQKIINFQINKISEIKIERQETLLEKYENQLAAILAS